MTDDSRAIARIAAGLSIWGVFHGVIYFVFWWLFLALTTASGARVQTGLDGDGTALANPQTYGHSHRFRPAREEASH